MHCVPSHGSATLWSRQQWEDLADRLLDGIAGHADETFAHLRPEGPASASGQWSDGLEGFARSFLLASFRVGGAGGRDPAGRLARYAEGLLTGTDPSSPRRWPRMSERRQARVEAASLVVALSETRPWLWDTLAPAEQEQVVDWLAEIVGTSDYRNNWLWFQNIVEAFLASVGGPWLQSDLDRNAELAESLYAGEGWYSDGRGRDGRRQNFDYYTGWAWHFYPLMEARMRGVPLDGAHRDRLAAYLEQAPLLVAPDGAPVMQGRSLTYRFALLAPFWAGLLADASPLSDGETRRLTSSVAQHFIDAGAVDETGVLSIGWHRAFPRLRQLYTGSGSPYWASKAFLGLLLPPSHPVWTAEDRTPSRDAVTPLAGPGWLVHRSGRDGLVRVINHGTDRLLEPAAAAAADDPFYHRLGYASHCSPQLSPDAIAAPLESHVALVDRHGLPSHRGGIERVHLGDAVAVSRSEPYWLDHGDVGDLGDSASWARLRRGPVLVVASVLHQDVELRLAWWEEKDEDARRGEPLPAASESPWPVEPGPWRLRFGGWALPGEPGSLQGGQPPDGRTAAVVSRTSDGLASTVLGALGAFTGDLRWRSGADPLAPLSATPWVMTVDTVPAGRVVGALISLSRSDVPPPGVEVAALPSEQLEVRWDDGTSHLVPAAPAGSRRGGGTGEGR